MAIRKMSNPPPSPLKIYIIAGEHSGDTLGAKLMESIKIECKQEGVIFAGLGGEAMQKEGLNSIFSIDEVAVMGIAYIFARLPNLIKRGFQLVDSVIKAEPDVLVIIDSPELTHRIATRVRKAKPEIPIINYVSPTVWAWRPGRAKKMTKYVDEVLALLPFEPEKHRELGGPPCSYVGHPLIELKPWLNELDETKLKNRLGLEPTKPVLAILPGSRPNEVKHLIQPFGEAANKLTKEIGPLEIIIPTVTAVRHMVEEGVNNWNLDVHYVEGNEDKYAAFKLADAALAASGTVTLELALSETPMVVAYKVDRLIYALRGLLNTEMVALANLILGYKCFPELLHKQCTGEIIKEHLKPLFSSHSKELKKQQAGLADITNKLLLAGPVPSKAAALRVLAHARPNN